MIDGIRNGNTKYPIIEAASTRSLVRLGPSVSPPSYLSAAPELVYFPKCATQEYSTDDPINND